MSAPDGQDSEAEAIDRVVEAFGNDALPDLSETAPEQPDPLPAGVTYASPGRRVAAWALEAVLVVVTLVVGWLIWAYKIGPGGQTPAKKLLGMRVVLNDQSESAGLSRMLLLRWFVGNLIVPLAAVVTLGIILLMPFWDRRNQNLWDKLSSCVVIHDPDGQWSGPIERSPAASGPRL